jgi:hypothetical protein
VTCPSKVIQVQLERKRVQKMMIWRMRHMCHHPRLILMAEERALLVPVAVGQQEMNKLRKKMMVCAITPGSSSWPRKGPC